MPPFQPLQAAVYSRSMTTLTSSKFDPIKLACWIGIAAYVIAKVVRLQQGATLAELFDFGDPSLWGLMMGACIVVPLRWALLAVTMRRLENHVNLKN